jgi:uncharacterized protein YbjT (DUF2867 family)
MEEVDRNKVAVIAGASGLVGGHLLNFLIDSKDYDLIRVITRKKLSIINDKVKQYIIDFDNPDSYKNLIQGDDLFLCLGTTMKKAGSQSAFHKVDYTYTTDLAKCGAVNGISNIFLISAMGANSKSLFFYNRVKGDAENYIGQLSQYESLHFFRPSLLLGERTEKRKGEEVGAVIGQFFRSLLGRIGANYHPIEAKKVAKYVYQTALNPSKGIHIYQSKEFQKIEI